MSITYKNMQNELDYTLLVLKTMFEELKLWLKLQRMIL